MSTNLEYTRDGEGETRSISDDEELAYLHGEGYGGPHGDLEQGRRQVLCGQPLQVVETLEPWKRGVLSYCEKQQR